jgi:hypothetical protein
LALQTGEIRVLELWFGAIVKNVLVEMVVQFILQILQTKIDVGI